MTRRGRVTIVALASALMAISGTAFSLAGSPGAEEMPSPTFVPSAEFRPAESPPLEILERLPVTRDALEMPTYLPAEISSPVSARAAVGALADGASPSLARLASSDVDSGRLYEMVDISGSRGISIPGPLRVEYTLDAQLTRQVFRVLRNGRVELGHVILIDPKTGRVLAYASTDVEAFPPTRAYPAASLVKVITAATALDRDREKASLPCRYRGSPYRLTPSRIDPPRLGKTVTLRRALATSNNQCFAQLAVHAVGSNALIDAISAFGWLRAPAPAHAPGRIDETSDRYELGRLGCGLSGCRITPLHAAQLAVVLAHGERIEPRWIERVVDAQGRELPIPATEAPRRVLSPKLAAELRSMLTETTESGTARSAFRKRNGRSLLGSVRVAGKTGSLSGEDPRGRYEWFIGAAPAEDPRIAIAVLVVQSDLWWRTASQIAGDVLNRVFCERGNCSDAAVLRWTRSIGPSGSAGPSPGT